MSDSGSDLPAFVVKAADFPALFYLDRSHPRPISLEWIDRGKDRSLRPTTVDMLLRTLFSENQTPSIRKLHESSGLRTRFRSERDRNRFAAVFTEARKAVATTKDVVITAVCADQAAADAKVVALREAKVPDEAISLVWRTSQYLQREYQARDGHSVAEVAGSMVGGGIAGAVLGVAVLFVPGVGPVAVAGSLVASAFGSIAAFSGIIGATGGGIAKMLSDHDVDGVAVGQFEEEIRRGKVFLSVDKRRAGASAEAAARILAQGDDGGSPA